MNTFTGSLPFSTQPQRPYIALAPMEGLMDHHLRDILTRVGGIDHCVTEFIRVVDQEYPDRVFYRLCPELALGGKTPAGTPVHVQLLGSNTEAMAANAVRAVKLGAPAIDINFGCPARTVNKSMGGAVLLQNPDCLHSIASAVRAAVPAHIPVSAKVRLGYSDKSQALDIAKAIDDSGVQWLTVHARTKVDGYKPPAYWDCIQKIKDAVRLPVIANGEIWTTAQARQCMAESGSDLLMIGRGLVSMPDLAAQIKADHGLMSHQAFNWQQQLALFLELVPRLSHLADKSATDRLKQWLFYFTRHYPKIAALFHEAKKEQEMAAFLRQVQKHLSASPELETHAQAQIYP